MTCIYILALSYATRCRPSLNNSTLKCSVNTCVNQLVELFLFIILKYIQNLEGKYQLQCIITNIYQQMLKVRRNVNLLSFSTYLVSTENNYDHKYYLVAVMQIYLLDEM